MEGERARGRVTRPACAWGATAAIAAGGSGVSPPRQGAPPRRGRPRRSARAPRVLRELSNPARERRGPADGEVGPGHPGEGRHGEPRPEAEARGGSRVERGCPGRGHEGGQGVGRRRWQAAPQRRHRPRRWVRRRRELLGAQEGRVGRGELLEEVLLADALLADRVEEDGGGRERDAGRRDAHGWRQRAREGKRRAEGVGRQPGEVRERRLRECGAALQGSRSGPAGCVKASCRGL